MKSINPFYQWYTMIITNEEKKRMKRHARFLLAAFCLLLMCSCGEPNILQREALQSHGGAADEASPAPDAEYNNSVAEQELPGQKPAEPPSAAVSIIKDDVDIDGDGIADSVHAYSTGLFELPFYVDISLSADNKTYHASLNTDCLDTGNKLRIADVTGDGVPEIVFPDLGGTSTRGEISAVALEMSGNGVKRMDVFRDGFFRKESVNFISNEVEADFTAPKLLYSIKSYPSGREYEIDLSDAAKLLLEHNEGCYSNVFFSFVTLAGDVVELGGGKYGIQVKTVIEADAEKADDGDTDFLSRYYLYSTLEYANGEWLVVDEYMQREDY